jgi:transposase InsO family protein
LRYQVISEIQTHLLAGKRPGEALSAVLALPHRDALDRSVRLSQRTVRRWLAAYRRAGLAGLEPRPRPRVPESAVLGAELLQFVRLEKSSDPDASVPELIERARLQGIVSEHEQVSRTSLWRACRRMGLPLRRPQRLAEKDMRRFAYPSRMLMVLCDGKHFRAGVKRARRVALHFLDDATRAGLEVIVGTAESTELFLHGLHRLIQRYGLCKALFLDHGSGFISEDTHAVLARLGIRLIHGTVAYPQGHGKVERFHRTAFERLLRTLDGNPEVDPDPGALSLRLWHWMHERYNHTPHESLGGQAPAERFRLDPRGLQLPSDPAWLAGCFLSTLERRVSSDNILSYGGLLYEVPRGHAKQRIRVTRHLLEHDALSILHEAKLLRLHPLDLTANAYSKRARPGAAPAKKPGAAPHSAAHLAFGQSFSPLVESDGGFAKGKDEDDDEEDKP